LVYGPLVLCFPWRVPRFYLSGVVRIGAHRHITAPGFTPARKKAKAGFPYPTTLIQPFPLPQSPHGRKGIKNVPPTRTEGAVGTWYALYTLVGERYAKLEDGLGQGRLFLLVSLRRSEGWAGPSLPVGATAGGSSGGAWAGPGRLTPG